MASTRPAQAFGRCAFNQPHVLRLRSLLWAIALLCAAAGAAAAKSAPSGGDLYSGMRWRLVGPFRGGRVLAVSGVANNPNLFYFGAVGGGVWKSTDAGGVWTPIFDGQPIASIGAIAVAPSDPNTIYVGSGEADMRSDITYGNGVYKSADAGKTWTHIGLDDSRQIGRIIVDPRDPRRLFVAALGHAYGPNAQRGVFRSTDGGRTWTRALYKDANTGASDLAFDPRDARIIYASLWQTRRPPWNVYPPSNGPGSGLYKSTDGGDTWTHLLGRGLPQRGLGKIGIAVAPSNPDRVYLAVDAQAGGLYRSDDAGTNWQRVDAEGRIWGRGWYFCEVTADPKDADTVYVSNTSLYRSRDGGRSFIAIKGAPGGDDYHRLWIDSNDPQRMILGSDQGAIVSVNGARTWSSWYNQPTSQFYHVATDRRFPYWIYGAQQDSGAIAAPSRSNHAGISAHDWRPITAGEESGYIAPDPLHPGIVFGGAFGGVVERYDERTGQALNVRAALAHPGSWRETWTLPLVFSAADPHALYFGQQRLFRTVDGGSTWNIVSPDLTRPDPGVPANLDAPTAADKLGAAKRRGVVYSIAPSPLRAPTIWAGTDDGLVYVTADGGAHWRNVTPPALGPWSKVGMIDASHFDGGSAYGAVDRHRLDDLRPYIYRTHDAGRSWRLVTRGIPAGSYVNVIREDPARRGLLYAGTETGMFVSFDDGDKWRPLQLDLPTTSIRDIAVADDDLVVATHGRGFWVLDDVTPLRQIAALPALPRAYLFAPKAAVRVRPGSDEGTPLPPETPAGENPPQGPLIDYYLKANADGALVLRITDDRGRLVRRYSSADAPKQVDARKLDIPEFWIRPQAPPAAYAGMHRFVWDLHYAPPSAAPAAGGEAPAGLWAPPGRYTVTMSVGGRTYRRQLMVKRDPRVSASDVDLQRQFDIARSIERSQSQAAATYLSVEKLRAQLGRLAPVTTRGALAAQAQSLAREASAIAGQSAAAPGPLGAAATLMALKASLGDLLAAVESADAAPTQDATRAYGQQRSALGGALTRWNRLKTGELPRLNARLRRAGLAPLSI
ncbi:MAG: hypothetical protein M3T49_08710 [Candidatus Eremiobacteraeota bacterium]|nr:hypothetical protein [Candidatus Eremiobacteraeota bacterium]